MPKIHPQYQQKIGFAPVDKIAETVAIAVCDTVMTSSPTPISKLRKANSIPSVPFATPTAYLAPINLQNFSQILKHFYRVYMAAIKVFFIEF